MVKTPLSRALCVCTAVCCGVVLLPTLSVQAQEDEALKAHRQMLPARCGAAAKACVPLVVHVVVDVEGLDHTAAAHRLESPSHQGDL
ncbi:MAG: hypothetical protein AAFX99_32205, partial [Myxococcota bacterium]